MLRWDVTIEIEGQSSETHSGARVTIGQDTVKLHHDRELSDSEVAAFVEGEDTFSDATQEMWVQSCTATDGALVLIGTELTGGASDIKGALPMKWTLRPA